MPENTHSSRRASWRAALRKALVPGLRAQGQDGGPPDLDELWRDFTTKLARFFGVGNRKGDAGGGNDRVGVFCKEPWGDIGRSSRDANDVCPALGHSNGQMLARECSSSVDQVRVHRYLA